MDPSSHPEKRRKIERVSAACDLCKARKVKCDGELPCSYCQRKNRADTCVFSAPRQRGTGAGSQSAGNTPANGSQSAEQPATSPVRQRTRSDPTRTRNFQGNTTYQGNASGSGHSLSPTVSRDDHHEDTAVPLEARLLRDAQGKVIFIGDCAPLSFLQTVRHLIASEVDPDGFPLQVSRDSVIEIAQPQHSTQQASHDLSNLEIDEVISMVSDYLVATSGLVDLFDRDQLFDDFKSWANGTVAHNASSSAVYYNIAAIGVQEKDSSKAEAWFNHAKDALQANLSSSMNLATVRGFALVAIYLLRGFQPNGAYLYFSLAARTAYAIGLHRTEVNASFGVSTHAIRDRIWKSLRVVDMLISNLLGRPPSTSDVDCTVKYSTPEISDVAHFHILDASVQIFMIIERVVVEVYSRKRISLRIANFVSHQLKSWASIWLRPLSDITSNPMSCEQESIVGACQTLCSYFYGIMLLTRPFLIYDLYEYLGASMRGAPATRAENQEKRKFADAALDAAVAFLETLETVIVTRRMPLRMPLIVSWLFTASLVLAVGVLGRSGLSFEEPCQRAIESLNYFAKVDPHAQQYSLVTQALLKTTKEHVEKREDHMRLQRKAASSQLFGLLPSTNAMPETTTADTTVASVPMTSTSLDQDASSVSAPLDWTFYDADSFALPWPNENDHGLQDFLQPGRHTLQGSLADIPLFPMYDQLDGSLGHDAGSMG